MSNNLIDIQQIKNVYNTDKQIIKLGLLNIRSLYTNHTFVNDMITDRKLDVLCLIETWLKPDWIHYLNKFVPQDYCYQNDGPHLKAKGDVFLPFMTLLSVFLRRQALSITPWSNGASNNIIWEKGIEW